jgi:hypothetical protein
MRKSLIIVLELPPILFTAALAWYAVTRPTVPPSLSCVFVQDTNELAGHRIAEFANMRWLLTATSHCCSDRRISWPQSLR